MITRIGNDATEETRFGRGVCRIVCFQTLFNIYFEKLVKEAIEMKIAVVGMERIQAIEYADNQAMLIRGNERYSCMYGVEYWENGRRQS